MVNNTAHEVISHDITAMDQKILQGRATKSPFCLAVRYPEVENDNYLANFGQTAFAVLSSFAVRSGPPSQVSFISTSEGYAANTGTNSRLTSIIGATLPATKVNFYISSPLDAYSARCGDLITPIIINNRLSFFRESWPISNEGRHRDLSSIHSLIIIDFKQTARR